MHSSQLGHHSCTLSITADRMDVISPRQIELIDGSILPREEVRVSVIQDYINGVLNTLDMSIREQLGNRDHLLVWSTDDTTAISVLYQFD